MQLSLVQQLLDRRHFGSALQHRAPHSHTVETCNGLSPHIAWVQSVKERWVHGRLHWIRPALPMLLHSARMRWVSIRRSWQSIQPSIVVNRKPKTDAVRGNVSTAPANPVTFLGLNQINLWTKFNRTVARLGPDGRPSVLKHGAAPSSSVPFPRQLNLSITSNAFGATSPIQFSHQQLTTSRTFMAGTKWTTLTLGQTSSSVFVRTRRIESKPPAQMLVYRSAAAPREQVPAARSWEEGSGVANSRGASNFGWAADPRSAQPNMAQITDEVVRQLDRRFLASRERLGRI